MFHADEEIASRPFCWSMAADVAGAEAAALPRPGERVAIGGCGTAYNLARSYAALREDSSAGETDAFLSSEIPLRRRYDRYLLISRPGTTTETLEALRQVGGRAPTTVITARPGTPLGLGADETILVDFADERSVMQTRFATSAMVVLRVQLREAAQVWVESYPAVDVRDAAVAALASVLTTFQRMLDVDLVVVGGGLSVAGDDLLRPLGAALVERARFGRPPRLVSSQRGSDAGCLGAAIMAWRLLGDTPLSGAGALR